MVSVSLFPYIYIYGELTNALMLSHNYKAVPTVKPKKQNFQFHADFSQFAAKYPKPKACIMRNVAKLATAVITLREAAVGFS